MNYSSLSLRMAAGALLLSCFSWWLGGGPALSISTVAAESATSYLRSDPDPTCRHAYNNDDESSCLNAKDHFGRPCQLCTVEKDTILCYNADEARWAKNFGATCKTSPYQLPTAE